MSSYLFQLWQYAVLIVIGLIVPAGVVCLCAWDYVVERFSTLVNKIRGIKP